MTAILPARVSPAPAPAAAAAKRPAPPPGDPPVLGPGAEVAPGYPVLEHVRRGADLDCYAAWSTERYCRCIVKTPRPDRAEDTATLRHLAREARLLCRLSHPHLVRGYEWLRPPRAAAPVLVTENLPGATLAHLLDVHGRLATEDLAQLGLHLCSVLRYLHDRGVLHLDVKPSNVIAAFGVAKLIDLSLARPPGRRTPGYGTLGYMSPEQVVGARLTAATDAWGLGLVLHEAATGEPTLPVAPEPSEGSGPPMLPEPSVEPVPSVPSVQSELSGLSAYEAVLVRPRHRLRARRRLPAEVASAIDGCLALQPRDRPSLRELGAALQTLAGPV